MNRLKQLRQARNLSCRALSEKTGIDFSTIAYCERGQRNFSVKTQDILADFFGVSVDYLLGKSAEDMYSDFLSSLRRDYDLDPASSLDDKLSDVPEPIRTKLSILFLLDGISLPSELDLNGRHYVLRYSYDHVDVACPSSQDYASAGDWVSLELEPDNPYDDRAVRLVLDNGRPLGYLYKGKLQDMANDFLHRHLPVSGLVEDDSASSILLGFYKED